MTRIRHGVVLALGPASLERVAGLAAMTRAVLTVHRGGVDEVVIVCGSAAVHHAAILDPRLPSRGVRMRLAEGGVEATQRALAGELDAPFVVAHADRGFDPAAVQAVIEQRGGPSGALVLAHDADEAVRALGLAVGDADDLGTAVGRRRAEQRLFAALTKPTDGWVSRHLNRPISLRVTRVLIEGDTTPNEVTVVAGLIAFAGIWLVASATWWALAVGAFLVHVQSVLDGCDGELARLKLQGSRLGEWLDNVLDDTINIAYSLAVGHASAVLLDAPWLRWVGVGAAIGYAIYNAILYVHLWVVFRRGNPFLFRWWFQRDDDYVQQSLRGPAGVLHAMGRRDCFLLAFSVLCLLRLPQVATLWYAAVAAISAGLAIAHVLAGGIGRARAQAHQASAASTRSA